MEFDIEQAFEEIKELWPKKKLTPKVDKNVFDKHIRSEEDVITLKNAIEVFLENDPSRVPLLYEFISKTFRSQEMALTTPIKNGEVTPDGGITNKGIYISKSKQEGNIFLEKKFDEIYETWPTTFDSVENRTKALAAFLSACKGETPENVLSACKTYSGAFNDATEGLVYPMLMRNFLADKETLSEWISKANGKGAFDEFTKKQFDAAYAWYPDFSSKETDRTKKASMVVWYRSVPKDERLDFLICCKTYYYERIKIIAESDSTNGNIFTKNFITFLGEWRQTLDKNDKAMNKRDMIGRIVCEVGLENDFDFRNIYGNYLEDFFLEKALPYFLYKLPTIRHAIRASIEKAIGNVGEAKKGMLNYNIDLPLAEKQIASVNIDKLTDTIMNKLIEVKSIDMPLSRD